MTSKHHDDGYSDSRHPSKRDLWITVVICVTAIVLIVATLNLIDSPMAPIETISPSRSPVASPACSLDRLHIRYGGSESGLLVSPIDKRVFLEALVVRCSNLTLKGDSVVQKAT